MPCSSMLVMENRSLLFSSCHLELAFSENIRAIKLPLLIKLPLIQNSNKLPLFYPKSPLFGAFLVKFWKNFNKPPAQNLDFFIDRWWFIGADMVLSFLMLYGLLGYN